MKYNRVNTTLTFSVALAGLALSVLTPVAYGHGNNPKNFSDTEPDTTPDPPGPAPTPPPEESAGQPNTEVDGGLPPVVLDSILDPGIVIGIDIAITGSFNVLSQVVSEPVAINMIVNPAEDFMPQIAVDLSGVSVTGSISAPMSGVIPAPGTLALFGLAAAAVGRRRRRH